MSQPKNLNVTVSDIVFEEGENYDKAQTSYAICINNDEIKRVPATAPEKVSLDLESLKETDVVRIKVIFPEQDKLYGCISLNMGEYFTEQPCGSFSQWITIFDTEDDDFFDGKMGEDDDEDPRIYVTLELAEAEAPAPVVAKSSMRKTATNENLLNVEPQQKAKKSVTLAQVNQEATYEEGNQGLKRMESQCKMIDQADESVLRLRTQRTQRQSVLINKSQQKTQQSTIKDAMTRRSTITGKQRGLSTSGLGRIQHNTVGLSSLFGGNAKARMRVEKIDMRKEKQLAIDWIKNETKKYDVTHITSEIELGIQASINKVNKSQKQMQQKQIRQLRPVNKVEQQHLDLVSLASQGQTQSERIQELVESSTVNFEAFNEANKDRVQQYQNQIEKSKLELQTLEAQLEKNNQKNKEFEVQLAQIREAAKQNLDQEEDPEVSQMKRQIEEIIHATQLLRDQILQKRAAMDQLIKDYELATKDMAKKLEDTDKLRLKAQNQAQKDQKDLFQASLENLRLKKVVFQQSQRVKLLGLQADQFEKRNKFLNLKQKGMLGDIERTHKIQIDELTRINTELDNVVQQVNVLQPTYQKNVQELERLNEGNDNIRAQNYEMQIEELENNMRKADQARRQAQMLLDQATGDWQAKIKLLTDPHADRAARTSDNVQRLRELTLNLKEKFADQDKLRKRRDEFMRQKNEQIGRTQLIDDYNNQSVQTEGMIEDLQKQIEDIEREIEDVKEALKERQRVIDQGIEQLNNLKAEQEDQEQELDRLNKLIDVLKKQNARYDRDIKDLEAEKAELQEKVDELELILANRQAELDESQQNLDQKEQAIGWQQNRLREKNKGKPVAPKATGSSYSVQKGDLLDEMFGRYVNEAGCKVPIKKLGGGFYLFGTRKIFAKILNGKLVIRVGGGYMIIQEFIATYAEVELRKLDDLRQKGIDPHAPEEPKKKPAGRNSAAGRGSPRADKTKTITLQQDVGVSGTHRTKRVTQSQLDKIKSDPRASRVLKD